MTRQATLFDRQRSQMTDSIQATIDSLNVYGPSHDHWSISWSMGKDSTALVTLIVWLILAGKIAAPRSLTILRADTRVELPALVVVAEQVEEELEEKRAALAALGCELRIKTVVAPLDDRFFVYMLGRGVPPPTNTFRWCTEGFKLAPMQTALEELACTLGLGAVVEARNRRFYRGHGAQKLLVLTGVRRGESDARDERIALSCSKGDAECGQGWFQVDLPDALCDKLSPIDTWRVCHVWEWNDGWAPTPEFGDWPTRLLARAYGGRDGNEAADKASRTGCLECPLVQEDRALVTLVRDEAWSYLAPLRRLRALYNRLHSGLVRLRKPGGERRADGELAKKQNRMGPIALEERLAALGEVLAIQAEVNALAAVRKRPRIDILNAEEEARIRELVAANTWPDRWSGQEPRATELHDMHNDDGTVQPLLPGLARKATETA